MKVTALRQFLYGPDGITATSIAVGDEADILDEMVPGLEKAGYIQRPKPDVLSLSTKSKRA
jgi:hypothetical protein